ncbi:MAG: alpha/beta hydrolase-fold protein [Acidobacteriota bacterium]
MTVLLCLAQSSAPQGPRPLTKELRIHKFHSEVMSRERSMVVMLPPGYDDAGETRYPVLYMHDGQSVVINWRLDELARPLFAGKQVEPMIFVAIFNGGTSEERFSDYTPTRDSEFAKSGNADQYGRMIVEELKPIIDAEYHTLSDPANTGIGGTSLGGLVSLYLALKYPAKFGKVAVMSPSIWWDKQMIIREVKRIKQKPPLKIWLDIGTSEAIQSIDRTKALRDALIGKGWKSDLDLRYFEAKGGEHDEKSFARRAPEVLKYLFPAQP